MVNHFEHHAEVSTKNELFRNIKSYSDEKQSNAFHMIPLTFCLKISADRQTQSIKQQLKPFKEVFNLLEEFKQHCNPDEEVASANAAERGGVADAETGRAKENDVTPNTSMSSIKVVNPYDQVLANPISVLVTNKGQE